MAVSLAIDTALAFGIHDGSARFHKLHTIRKSFIQIAKALGPEKNSDQLFGDLQELRWSDVINHLRSKMDDCEEAHSDG